VNIKMFFVVLIVVLLATVSGCSTLDHRGEDLATGSAVGAVLGYGVAGEPGAFVGGALGGLVGHIFGRNREKEDGMHERSLAMQGKSSYTSRMGVEALTSQINGASNCIAKGFSQEYCLKAFGLENAVEPQPKQVSQQVSHTRHSKDPRSARPACARCHK